MSEYFAEGEVDTLNVRASRIIRFLFLSIPLSDRLKARIAPNSPEYQFGFTGFKRSSEGLAGQFLVAIQVPDKPDGYAYWYSSVPAAGVPKPYEKGAEFEVTNRLTTTDVSDEQLTAILQGGVVYLVQMLEAAY